MRHHVLPRRRHYDPTASASIPVPVGKLSPVRQVHMSIVDGTKIDLVNNWLGSDRRRKENHL